jgi:hypothetical protein
MLAQVIPKIIEDASDLVRKPAKENRQIIIGEIIISKTAKLESLILLP